MSFSELKDQMKKIICNLKPGTVFLLKDILRDPPALLGRRLHEAVKSGEIPDVEFIGKEANLDQYRKK